jgi:hypothetical protein
MSLPRISYLESWEQQPPPLLRQQSNQEHQPPFTLDCDETESIETLNHTQFLSSSFPSGSGHRTVRHRLSFNPYSGRGWSQSSAADTDEERRSLLRSDVIEVSDGFEPAKAQADPLPTEYVFQDPNWETAETTAAYEVSKGMRIGMYCPRLSVLLYT